MDSRGVLLCLLALAVALLAGSHVVHVYLLRGLRRRVDDLERWHGGYDKALRETGERLDAAGAPTVREARAKRELLDVPGGSHTLVPRK